MGTGQAKCGTDKSERLLCLGKVWTGRILNVFVRSSIKISAQWTAAVCEGKSFGSSQISAGGSWCPEVVLLWAPGADVGENQHEAAVPPLSHLPYPWEMPVASSGHVLVASVKHLKLRGMNLGGIVRVSGKEGEEQSVSER